MHVERVDFGECWEGRLVMYREQEHSIVIVEDGSFR